MDLFYKIVIFSLAGIPVPMLINKFLKYIMQKGAHSIAIALTGIVFLVGLVMVIHLICSADLARRKITNKHFYLFSLFSLTSVLDLGIGLEVDGYMTDFIAEYLLSGEPYLASRFGALICYFDGSAMYAMYLLMLHAIINNYSYRNVAIFWLGAILNSMVVALLAIFTGKYGILPSTALNIPYIIAPVFVCLEFLQSRRKYQPISLEYLRPLLQRPLDIFLIVYLVFATVIAIVRGMAVMENHSSIAEFYITKIEPYLLYRDPCPFVVTQMLVYLFYLVPIHLMSIYAMIKPGCSWMLDLTLFHAGAYCQGQFAHILTAISSDLPEKYRIPDSSLAQIGFWLINLMLAFGPQLLLIRCFTSPDFFSDNYKSRRNTKIKSK